MSDDNWLDAQLLTCPGCGATLYAVLHSPFCDDYRLCCDRCPKAVEVSFYDPVCVATAKSLPVGYNWEQIIAAIEPLLRSCSCGGQFRGDAVRRCHMCVTEIPAAALKDLYPCFGCEVGSRDPTEEEQLAFDKFEREFVQRVDLWSA